MRNYFFVTVICFAMAGCQSLTRPEQGWLTPKKSVDLLATNQTVSSGQVLRGQAPVDPFLNAAPIPAATVPPAAVPLPAQSVYGAALPTPTPLQAAAEHQAKDIPVGSSPPLHDPFAGVQQIPAIADNSPWSFADPDAGVNHAVSIEEAAKKEEAERERARLEALATAKPQDGTPDYLKPLEKWNGPFETRQKTGMTERDIIRQVSLVDVKTVIDTEPVYDWEKEQEKGFDWGVLDPVNFFTKVRDWMGMGPDETKATAAMKRGNDILDPIRNKKPDPKDQKLWLEAAKQFEEAAKRWPNSVIEEDSLHLAGECYFFADNYPAAMTAYQKLVINYQHSKHVDNAVRRLFRIARFWEKEDQRGVSFTNMSRKDRTRPTFDTFGNAKKAYETIFINDPNGPVSDDAVMALASAYFVKGKYKGDPNFDEAARYYGYLRENYPLSKHIVKAHEYEVIARTNAYMGAEHSSTTLDEAGKLADRALAQFGGELESGSREELLAQKEAIITSQAEKEWVTGQFWDKKSQFGAARLQYEKILDRYPQTPFAERARIRLEQIKHKPAQPNQLDFFRKFYKPRGSI